MKTDANAACLEIHVHGVDGYVSTFAQQDAKLPDNLIEQIHSGRIFTLPAFMIASRHSFTIFPASQIVRVDLVMRGFPDWSFPGGIENAAEITEEEFVLHLAAASETAVSNAARHTIYAEFEMTNGKRLYLAFAVHFREDTLTPLDFGLLLQHLLTSPTFYARRLGGGAVVLNPAHFLRVQLSPAPVQPPSNAWIAEPITLSAGRCRGQSVAKEPIR